jgi:hypothetical protein
MVACSAFGPALEGGTVDLDGAPALTTDEMVVMRLTAFSIDGLPRGRLEDVSQSVINEGLQCAVDRCQPHRIPAGA